MIVSSNSFQRLIDMKYIFTLLFKDLTVDLYPLELHLPIPLPQGLNGISVSNIFHHHHHHHYQIDLIILGFFYNRLTGNTEMRFGGLISTSNLVKEEIITVESDSDLLWTISIKKTGFPVQDHKP